MDIMYRKKIASSKLTNPSILNIESILFFENYFFLDIKINLFIYQYQIL